MTVTDVPTGIPERYAVEALVGEGAFARVYRARDGGTGGSVAIKVLHSSVAAEAALRRRFSREIEACRRVRHPNLVRVLDAGVDASLAYVVLEYLDARDLKEVLLEGPLEPSTALATARQVASALSALHDAGLIHRDVKPANVMLEASGRAVLMDLNLVLDVQGTALTKTGQLLGTPLYMAPEQFLEGTSSPASDIYSLGVLLWEMLTGRTPFGRTRGVAELARAVAVQLLPPPSQGRAGVPRGVDALVARLTAKDPAHRPGSAAEVEKELAALEGLSPDVPPPRPTPGDDRRLRTLATMAVLLALAALGLVPAILRPGAAPAPSIVGPLTVRPCIAGALLSWRMDRPSPVLAGVMGPDGRLLWQGTPTTTDATSRLTVPRRALAAGAVAAVLLPSSSTPLATAPLQAVPEVTVSGPIITHDARGTQTAWFGTMPLAGTVRIAPPPTSAPLDGARTDGVSHAILLPLAERLTTDFEVRLTLRDEAGETLDADPAILPALSLNRLEAALDAFDSDGGLDRALQTMALPGRGGLPAVLADLNRREDLNGVGIALAEASTALFASPLLDDGGRRRLFSLLSRLYRIDMLLVTEGQRARFGWTPATTGWVDLRPLPENPFGGTLPPGVVGMRPDGTTKSLWPDRPSWLDGAPVRLVFVATNAYPSQTYELTVPPGWTAGCRLGRATLHLGIKVMFPGAVLHVRVNDGVDVPIWSPVPSQATDKQHVVVDLPAAFLRDGTNTIRMTIHQVSLRHSLDFALVKDVTLAQGPSSDYTGPIDRPRSGEGEAWSRRTR